MINAFSNQNYNGVGGNVTSSTSADSNKIYSLRSYFRIFPLNYMAEGQISNYLTGYSPHHPAASSLPSRPFRSMDEWCCTEICRCVVQILDVTLSDVRPPSLNVRG